MKKIILMTICLVFIASMACAIDITGSNNGGGDVTVASGEKEPGNIAVLSNNVYATFVSSDDQFAGITKHVNGSKNYATSSESTKIWWIGVVEANEGKATMEISLTASDTSQFTGTGWYAL